MTRVADLKNQLANANNSTEYWKKTYQNQCEVTRTQYTQINNLHNQVAQLRESIKSLHDHYQKALENQDQTHADTLEACAQLAGNAIKSQAEQHKNQLEKVMVEDMLTLAEVKGQRDAMDRAFKYLADRD